jgi:hypothetical protein
VGSTGCSSDAAGIAREPQGEYYYKGTNGASKESEQEKSRVYGPEGCCIEIRAIQQSSIKHTVSVFTVLVHRFGSVGVEIKCPI